MVSPYNLGKWCRTFRKMGINQKQSSIQDVVLEIYSSPSHCYKGKIYSLLYSN